MEEIWFLLFAVKQCYRIFWHKLLFGHRQGYKIDILSELALLGGTLTA